MTFQYLLDGVEFLSQSGNPDVTGVEYDSRRVKPGCVFVAMRGESSDGNRFIDQAIQAGAVAVVTDSPEERPREGVAWAQVPHGRRALARISENFYQRPAERIAITGITGTNGKSTTAFLIESILTAERVSYFVADQNMAAAEGSLGFLPRRILVDAHEEERARRLIAEAGLGKELRNG